MNKLILAFTLLLTPFFSQFSIAASVLPEASGEISYCGGWASDTACLFGLSPSSSHSGAADNYASFVADSLAIATTSTNTYLDSTVGETYKYKSELSAINIHDAEYVHRYLSVSVTGKVSDELSCPSEYIYGVDTDNDAIIDECHNENPNLEVCPQGNYRYRLAGGCVPIDCGSSGQQNTMWASGDVYSNSAGTYCDGSCAHTVTGGQNSDGFEGSIGITGVSTGEICGQGGTDDRWHNEGNGDNCVSENGFLSCPNGDTPDTPTETEPTVNLEPELLTLEEITPLIPTEEVCASGDVACEVRNLKETIVVKGLEQKEIDKLLHNKNITADTKTSTKIIDGLTASAGRNAQGLEMVTTAIDGLRGEIGTGGTNEGNGDGFGDGDVTCDGDDCEGGIQTDIEPTAGLEGFWETEYEDGLEGMFLERLEEYKTTEFFLFLDQFNPQLSSGTAPNYNWCFNFGQYMNFGCHNVSIDPRVFPALRIFILISAAFACRIILFGG